MKASKLMLHITVLYFPCSLDPQSWKTGQTEAKGQRREWCPAVCSSFMDPQDQVPSTKLRSVMVKTNVASGLCPNWDTNTIQLCCDADTYPSHRGNRTRKVKYAGM